MSRIHLLFDQMPDAAKFTADTLTVGVTVGSLLAWVPEVTSVLGLVWISLRVANEIETTIARRREKRRDSAPD